MPTDADFFLKLWAVLGPLLVAVLSAWWNSRERREEREKDERREKRREDREDRLASDVRQLEQEAKRKDELKNAVTGYMAAVSQYIYKRSTFLTSPSPEKEADATRAYELVAVHCQECMILGSYELTLATVEVNNTIMTVPCSWDDSVDEAYLEKVQRYRTARKNFHQEARRCLGIDVPEVESV